MQQKRAEMQGNYFYLFIYLLLLHETLSFRSHKYFPSCHILQK